MRIACDLPLAAADERDRFPRPPFCRAARRAPLSQPATVRASDSRGDLQQRRHGRRVAQSPDHLDGRQANLLVASGRGLQHGRRQHDAFAIADGVDDQRRSFRRGLGQLRRQRLDDLVSRQLAGRAQTQSETLPCPATSVARPAAEFPRSPRAIIAPRVASRIRCFGTSALRIASYTSTAASFLPSASNRSAHKMPPSAMADRTAGFAPANAWWSAWIALLAADLAERNGGGRCHFLVVIVEPRGQLIDGLRRSLDADRIDHAHQQLALQLAGRFDQRRVGRRIGNRLQRNPRPRRQAARRSAASPIPAPPPCCRRSTVACRRRPSLQALPSEVARSIASRSPPQETATPIRRRSNPSFGRTMPPGSEETTIANGTIQRNP